MSIKAAKIYIWTCLILIFWFRKFLRVIELNIGNYQHHIFSHINIFLNCQFKNALGANGVQRENIAKYRLAKNNAFYNIHWQNEQQTMKPNKFIKSKFKRRRHSWRICSFDQVDLHLGELRWSNNMMANKTHHLHSNLGQWKIWMHILQTRTQ